MRFVFCGSWEGERGRLEGILGGEFAGSVSMSEEEEKKLEQKRKRFTVAGYEATGAGGKEGGKSRD